MVYSRDECIEIKASTIIFTGLYETPYVDQTEKKKVENVKTNTRYYCCLSNVRIKLKTKGKNVMSSESYCILLMC